MDSEAQESDYLGILKTEEFSKKFIKATQMPTMVCDKCEKPLFGSLEACKCKEDQ